MKKSNAKKTLKAIDSEFLDWKDPGEDREPILDEMVSEESNAANWSEAQDRGEDLANISDPFIHGPELQAETPPELSQKRTGETLKFNENLAKRFDTERKSQPPF